MVMVRADGRRLLCGVALLAVVGIVGGTTKGALITLSLEFTDLGGTEITDVTGDGVPDIGPGSDFENLGFILHILVDGPAAGVTGGKVNISMSPDIEFVVDSFTLNPTLQFFTNGSIHDTAPQLLEAGGATFDSGFCADEDWWLEVTMTANSTPGIMDFTTAQGETFAIYGAGNTSDVDWGTGSLNVTPEPTSLCLLALGGILALRRRRK